MNLSQTLPKKKQKGKGKNASQFTLWSHYYPSSKTRQQHEQFLHRAGKMNGQQMGF
jgi:hypothetical protein